MSGPMVDFGFGFNDTSFSDRVLRIVIIDESLNSIPNRKITRKDLGKENVVETITWHINSLLLAANSPFFHRLFKNGMRDSQQSDVTLRINASEIEALMDIVKFIYSHTLNATTTADLLDVLTVAEKFEVTSCKKYCSKLLTEKLMSLEDALLYLELPTSVSVSEVEVRPLIDAAKRYLFTRYSDFDMWSQEQAMGLPLCAIEAILGGHGLQVDSEDDVFDFVLKWACVHYPKLKERRKILTKRLARCLCFSCMSSSRLKKVLVSHDFDHEQVSLVTDALFVKVDQVHASKVPVDKKCDSLGRIYKLRPIKVVQFELPQPRCVVYFDLTKKECENLFESMSSLSSERFSLGGRSFFLSAECNTKERNDSFGLFVHVTEESKGYTIVDIEFAVMMKSAKKFKNKRKGGFNINRLNHGYGIRDLLGISWIELMSEGCEYFIDGILHLRVDLTIYH